MDRARILDVLRRQKRELEKQFGVTKLGIFGSLARDETTEDSDIDVVVEMRKPDLFFLVHIKDSLEESLRCPVGVVHYRERMNPFLKGRIEREAVYV
jgi:predicted nucleotidyltransferase